MSTEEFDGELTGKQGRALEEGGARGAARRRRLKLLGGAVAIVVIVVVVVLVASGGGAHRIEAAETSVTKQIAVLLGGIPQVGNTLGKPTAPIKLEYFGDLECPPCREFTLDVLPLVINRWVRDGDLRIEYHSLETATRDPETFKKQQVAALAAGAQDRMWYFVETFYHEQGEEDSGYVTESYLDGIAKQVPGLDLPLWQTDRSDPKLTAQVEGDAQTAHSDGFTDTPSFLIGRTGRATSKLGSGLLSGSTFNGAIEKLLKTYSRRHERASVFRRASTTRSPP
jgi:protein-disulfide isomerase